MSGLIQTADSLTAVNKLVFEDKTISMERLWEGLRTNFENDEVLHAILVNKAPKYGNDIEEADQTARKLGQYLCNAISRRKHLSGAPLRPGLFSFLQFMNGENCAALPDSLARRHAHAFLIHMYRNPLPPGILTFRQSTLAVGQHHLCFQAAAGDPHMGQAFPLLIP